MRVGTSYASFLLQLPWSYKHFNILNNLDFKPPPTVDRLAINCSRMSVYSNTHQLNKQSSLCYTHFLLLTLLHLTRKTANTNILVGGQTCTQQLSQPTLLPSEGTCMWRLIGHKPMWWPCLSVCLSVFVSAKRSPGWLSQPTPSRVRGKVNASLMARLWCVGGEEPQWLCHYCPFLVKVKTTRRKLTLLSGGGETCSIFSYLHTDMAKANTPLRWCWNM